VQFRPASSAYLYSADEFYGGDNMKKMAKFMVLALLVFAFVLGGCGPSTQDVLTDEGEKIGEVETKVTDEGTETTMKIDPFAKEETVGLGEPCEDDRDCGAWDDLVACRGGKCIETECNFMSDCPEDAVVCFMDMCMTEEELLGRFGTWTISSWCEGECENCKTGKFQNTMQSSREGQEDYRICPDCTDDFNCKEGFWCDLGKCVPY
jgi:hypothetical protein